VDPDTLTELELLAGDGLLALAGRIGAVRLIDNTILSAPRARSKQPLTEGAPTCSA
jgi:hypothetical protein